jgi:hypothetical protein
VHDHHARHADNAGDRSNIANKIEIELVVKGRVDRVVAASYEQRIAVRRCAHDRLGADIAAGSRSVLDHEWLAEALRQPLSHQARDGVGRAASGEWRDEMYRSPWIGLRPRETRDRRQRGSAGSQMEKISAGKFHF